MAKQKKTSDNNYKLPTKHMLAAVAVNASRALCGLPPRGKVYEGPTVQFHDLLKSRS